MIDTFEDAPPADYLLRLATSDVGLAYKAAVVNELDLREGHTVVDLGCGPGVDLPALAERVGSTGRVIAIDHDPDAVAVARLGVAGSPQVVVREGDVHSPGLAPGSVDRVHTDRVLQHVADPGLVLRRACRALRLGGRAVLAEPDWGTLAIDHPEPALTHAYRQFVLDGVVRNPTVGRQVPRLAASAGLSVTHVEPVTTVFRDVREADRVLGFARVTWRAVESGYLDEAAAQRWLDHLAREPFFGSLTLFVTTADLLDDVP